jgi:uncharacterized protein (TIGR00369 family)
VDNDWPGAASVSDGTNHRSQPAEPSPLTELQQQERREWFRDHLQHGVLFNRFCDLEIRRWDSDQVEFHLPYADNLSAHFGVFHGGVICALIDTCGSGAVMAGHDFNKGSRLTTVSLAVQYLSVSAGEGALAVATCSKRGRNLHFSEVEVYAATSGKRLASGQVTANVAGERYGVPGITVAGQPYFA